MPHHELHQSAKTIGQLFHQADRTLPQYLTEKEVDHFVWRGKIEEDLLKNLPTIDVTTDEHRCGLGIFLYGEEGQKALNSDKKWGSLLMNWKSCTRGCTAPPLFCRNSGNRFIPVWSIRFGCGWMTTNGGPPRLRNRC